MRKVKRRIWHLTLAVVFGVMLGCGSMAFYLYVSQVKIEDNTEAIQRQEKRLQRLERPKAVVKPTKKPAASPKRSWQLWRDK